MKHALERAAIDVDRNAGPTPTAERGLVRRAPVTKPNPEVSRRHCMGRITLLTAMSLAFVPTLARGQLIAPPASDKKVAALATVYRRFSHADNIVTRFMEGYSIVGRSFPPPCKVASLYIEQVPEIDIGRPLAKQWGIPLAKTATEAVTLGGAKLAVDGVLIIAEHGDYPINEKGQKLYPRRRLFEDVVNVFRASGRSVPVFVDKHLAYNWTDAKWMYDQHKELGFPMMAGSSVPVAPRQPDLRPDVGVEWQSALAVGYGSAFYGEAFGYHSLEGLQVMMERRKGGETGVKAVHYPEGKAAWEAAKAGQWDCVRRCIFHHATFKNMGSPASRPHLPGRLIRGAIAAKVAGHSQ